MGDSFGSIAINKHLIYIYVLYHAKSIAPYSKRRGEKPRLNFGAVG